MGTVIYAGGLFNFSRTYFSGNLNWYEYGTFITYTVTLFAGRVQGTSKN